MLDNLVPFKVKMQGGMMNRLDEAIVLAVNAHAGQTDKAGKPYILHPFRVMQGVAIATGHDEEAMITAVLHDVVEDGGIKPKLLKERFGERVAGAVDAVTRADDESYSEFVLRASRDAVARIVKLADVQDNLDAGRMAELSADERSWLTEKYSKAREVLLAAE